MSRDLNLQQSDITAARERVSFLQFALDHHRRADSTHSEVWRRLDSEYVRQLEEAQKILADLESSSKAQ